MDIGTRLESIDILQVINRDSRLAWTSRYEGGEYSGPCPFCGGVDRFNVWPNHGSGQGCFWCRQCDAKGDALDYIKLRDRVDTRTAAATLGISGVPGRKVTQPRQSVQKSQPRSEVTPPSRKWQARAREFLTYAQLQLWTNVGTDGLNYLRSGGLIDETIWTAGIGFNPQPIFDRPERWGLSGKKIFLGRGVVIPHDVDSHLWNVKIRLVPPVDRGSREQKYSGPRGGVICLYGAGNFRNDGRPLLLTEDERDCLLACQALSDVVDVATLAGANRNIPSRWLIELLPYRHMLIAYDMDDAGHSGAARLVALSHRVQRLPVPHGNDLTAFYQQGGDLLAWIHFHLARLGLNSTIGTQASRSVAPSSSMVERVKLEDLPDYLQRNGYQVIRSLWPIGDPTITLTVC